MVLTIYRCIMSIQFLTSSRGKPLLWVDHYIYRKDRDTRDGGTSWRCNRKGCEARIHTANGAHDVSVKGFSLWGGGTRIFLIVPPPSLPRPDLFSFPQRRVSRGSTRLAMRQSKNRRNNAVYYLVPTTKPFVSSRSQGPQLESFADFILSAE